MFRKRFSFISVTAMISATVFAVLAVFRYQGAVGFSVYQGFPFTWFWYKDLVVNNDPGFGYRWGVLVLDVVIWLLAIIAFGLCVENIAQRFSRRHGTNEGNKPAESNAGIASRPNRRAMKSFLVVVATAAIAWITFSVIHGVRTGTERLWLISAIKAPGRMALSEIQADMNAGRHALAKAKIDVLMETWQRFDSGPDSFRGSGIGGIMVAFSKLDTNSSSTHTNKMRQSQ